MKWLPCQPKETKAGVVGKKRKAEDVVVAEKDANPSSSSSSSSSSSASSSGPTHTGGGLGGAADSGEGDEETGQQVEAVGGDAIGTDDSAATNVLSCTLYTFP